MTLNKLAASGPTTPVGPAASVSPNYFLQQPWEPVALLTTAKCLAACPATEETFGLTICKDENPT